MGKNANTALSSQEEARFVECESVIERGQKTFVSVGLALAEIRDSRLYRVDGRYASFEHYCRSRWNLGRSYVNKQISAAQTVELLKSGGQGTMVPKNERQVRPLLQFAPEDVPKVWSRVVETVGSSGESALTARRIEKQISVEVANAEDGPFKKLRIARKRAERERKEKQATTLSAADDAPSRSRENRFVVAHAVGKLRESIFIERSGWPKKHWPALEAMLRDVADEIHRELGDDALLEDV